MPNTPQQHTSTHDQRDPQTAPPAVSWLPQQPDRPTLADYRRARGPIGRDRHIVTDRHAAEEAARIFALLSPTDRAAAIAENSGRGIGASRSSRFD